MKHLTQKKQRGVVLILFGVMAFALFGLVGFSVDVGYLEAQHIAAQTAADAAAVAAAQEALVYSNANDTQVRKAARTAAALNGFTDGASSTSVGLTRSGNNLTVTISRTAPSLFSRLFRSNYTLNVSATSKLKQDNSGCLYALAPTGSRTFMSGGQSDIITDCAIKVKSTDSQAVYWDAGACTTAASISIGGNFGPNVDQWPYQGGCGLSPESFTKNSSVNQTLAPVTGAAAPADPFTTFPVPPIPGTCDYTNKTIDSSTMPSGTLTLNPGVYCGGISIGIRTVVFNPGTYILTNGVGLKVDSNSTVSGAGVFFYVHGNSGSNTPVVFSSNGVRATFSAPTSGPYQGMLFFNDTVNTGMLNQVNGDASTVFNGSIYFPNSQLVVSGSGSGLNANGSVKIVAQKVTVNGQAVLRISTGSTGGSGTSTGIVLTQ